MVLLVHKLKLPTRLDNHHPKSDPLHGFRSKISGFITQVLVNPEPGSGFLSLAWFQKCFDLINITNRAFAKLVVEIDYPSTRWGGKATDAYLNHTLDSLNLLNSISSSVSHLNQAKVSVFHALGLINNSCPSAAKHLKKIVITPDRNIRPDFNFKSPCGILEKSHDPEKESVILEAVTVLRKVGFLALGMVLSGLCGEAKPYLEMRKSTGGYEDSLLRGLDSRFCKEMTEIQGGVEEVKEVNHAIEHLSRAIMDGRYKEALTELKARLEALESSIQGLEKLANNLFSEVLGTRSKLIDNHRLTGRNH